jgi:hypothetical protein
MCITPHGSWERRNGGREYRGIRTSLYTYVRDIRRAWLMFNNKKDPYQLNNLCGDPKYAKLEKDLDDLLFKKLKQRNDKFLPGQEYIKQRGYEVDETGTIPYKP